MKKRKLTLIKTEQLVEDESVTLHRSRGNGVIRRQVWSDGAKVTRYSLAYINHDLYASDNGRVLGYDNSHGFHHRHYMGEVEPVEFGSFTEIEATFQQEFEVLYEKLNKKK